MIYAYMFIHVPQREKTCLWGLQTTKAQTSLPIHAVWMGENLSSGFANNKGADQPVHPCSLVSAFFIHLLESIISKLHTREITPVHIMPICSYMRLDGRKPVFGVCEQQRRRPACPSTQSGQHLFYLFIGKYRIQTFYKRNFKILVQADLSITLS